uniref:Uncharacterized protein n=1 Tax=Lepeophtheirus salmonis TaxID=72036 RepID=A0A0K2V6W0_LEPSM
MNSSVFGVNFSVLSLIPSFFFLTSLSSSSNKFIFSCIT